MPLNKATQVFVPNCASMSRAMQHAYHLYPVPNSEIENYILFEWKTAQPG